MTRTPTWAFRIAPLLLAAALGCGWEPPGKPRRADRPVPPDQVLDFDTLFAHNCSGCHGAEGRWGAGPPLADALFLAIIPPGAMTKVVSKGRAGTMMPAFAQSQGGRLTDDQINAIVAGIRARWGQALPPGEAPPPGYLAEPASAGPETIAAGAQAFAKHCASCHGADGEGTEKAGAINDPAFLGLSSDPFLRRIIITGRPDLGMPDFRRAGQFPNGPMTEQEIRDIVALLSSWRRPLSGKPLAVAPASSAVPPSAEGNP